MTRRTGPRPPAIRWFAALYLSAALVSLADAIAHLPPHSDRKAWDVAVIVMSAKLTIALMTIGLVWFFALRFARWLVPLSVAARLAIIAYGALRVGLPALTMLSPLFFLSTALGAAAAVALFTAGGRRWFTPAAQVDDVFA